MAQHKYKKKNYIRHAQARTQKHEKSKHNKEQKKLDLQVIHHLN
jgi:hypothetical protein